MARIDHPGTRERVALPPALERLRDMRLQRLGIAAWLVPVVGILGTVTVAASYYTGPPMPDWVDHLRTATAVIVGLGMCLAGLQEWRIQRLRRREIGAYDYARLEEMASETRAMTERIAASLAARERIEVRELQLLWRAYARQQDESALRRQKVRRARLRKRVQRYAPSQPSQSS